MLHTALGWMCFRIIACGGREYLAAAEFLDHTPVLAVPRAGRDQAIGWLEGGFPVQPPAAASAFAVRVWDAVQRIPAGAMATYGGIAADVGCPGAARAVGGALAHNPWAIRVPCHRVVSASGAPGGFRWGLERKRALLAWEREGRDVVRALVAGE